MFETLNRYSHGLAAIPLFHALRARGCVAAMEEAGTFSSRQLVRKFSANAGYLAVAIRMLEELDWVRPAGAGRYAVTPEQVATES